MPLIWSRDTRQLELRGGYLLASLANSVEDSVDTAAFNSLAEFTHSLL